MARKVRVIQRPIPPEIYDVHGQAKWDDNIATITIDPNLPPKDRFVALHHEIRHVVDDDDTENNAAKWDETGLLLWGQRKLMLRMILEDLYAKPSKKQEP